MCEECEKNILSPWSEAIGSEDSIGRFTPSRMTPLPDTLDVFSTAGVDLQFLSDLHKHRDLDH